MEALRILHLEDDAFDAELVHRTVDRWAPATHWISATSRSEFLDALASQPIDAVLSDNSIHGIDGLQALTMVRKTRPDLPFIFVSGNPDDRRAQACVAAGASDYVCKDQLWRLEPALHSLQAQRDATRMTRLHAAHLLLVRIVQQLSLARSVDAIVDIVRRGARELSQADGATVVFRDGDQCHYIDEDAIEPLWKGKRFPMSACVSGWAMLNRQPAVVPDIYDDPRVPVAAYRPTFVKSMVMVPIRSTAPIGAIGNYWATPHAPSVEEVTLIQALADTTSVAIENVQLYSGLEQRVRDRTDELVEANKELEAFSYSVSHDLRAPLRAVTGYADLLTRHLQPPLEGDASTFVQRIQTAAQRMNGLIDDMLSLSKVTRAEVRRRPVDLSLLAREILSRLQAAEPQRQVQVNVAEGLHAEGDINLLRLALENLLSNAWKYSGKRSDACIALQAEDAPDGGSAFCVRDNGAGFDMAHAQHLFEPFRRMHSESEFPGSGVGLAIVRRVVHKHGGHIHAEAVPGEGACFHVWLPAQGAATTLH